jgi:hypothetical protein
MITAHHCDMLFPSLSIITAQHHCRLHWPGIKRPPCAYAAPCTCTEHFRTFVTSPPSITDHHCPHCPGIIDVDQWPPCSYAQCDAFACTRHFQNFVTLCSKQNDSQQLVACPSPLRLELSWHRLNHGRSPPRQQQEAALVVALHVVQSLDHCTSVCYCWNLRARIV